MNKQEILLLIDSMNISKDDFVVLSTSALVIRGIVDEARDLDIAVSKSGLQQLKKQYKIIPKNEEWFVVSEKIECIVDDMVGKKEFFGGYYLQDIKNYLKYLKQSKKEKDKKRIPLVEAYIKGC